MTEPIEDTARDTRAVVGVDGSPTSEEALPWAFGEAESAGARLVVLRRSVSRAVVQHVPCPVAVIRHRADIALTERRRLNGGS